MGKKLYVGNLGYGVTDTDLQQLFTPHGSVESATVVMERDTGVSKGFGFVEMSSDEQAQVAISAMNGHDHDGRPLKVDEAKPRESRGPSNGRVAFGGGNGTS